MSSDEAHGNREGDVSTLPLADELFLARRWRLEGHIPSRDRIVAANLVHVRRLAKKLARGEAGALEDDFYSEGCIGLLKALKRFDPERGFRFITYAAPWIRVAMINHLIANVSISSGRSGPKYRRIYHAMRRDLEALDLSDPDVLAVVQSVRCGREEYDESRDESEVSNPEELAITAELVDNLTRAISSLPSRRRAVILGLYFGTREPSRQHVGDAIGVSRERVRQIEGQAISALRERICRDSD